MSRASIRVGIGIASLIVAAQGALAQEIFVQAPQRYVSDSFYEMYGIHWGFNLNGPGGGVFFNNGGFGNAIPPFGGFDPNAAARFGFAGGGPNGGFFFNFVAGQGSNRSMTTSTPLLTLPNGGAGAMYSTTLNPFVTGLEPVVGQAPRATNPLRERLQRIEQGETPGPRAGSAPSRPIVSPNAPAAIARPGAPANSAASPMANPAADGPPAVAGGGAGSAAESSAARGDLSVAEIRRQQAEEDAQRQREIDRLVAEAESAEALGKPGAARIFYQQALRRAPAERRRELTARLERLGSP